MALVNRALRALFDLLLSPFRGLDPMVGLAVVSLLTAVVMLLVFKYTSNQKKLAVVKRRIQAGLFEIRLFNDDLRAILRAQMEILRHNLGYVALTLVPLLVMLPFIVLAFAQMEFHYGTRPLRPGETTVLTAELEESWEASAPGAVTPAGRPRLELAVPDGLSLDSPEVWVPSRQEMAWRLRADEPGAYELGLTLGAGGLTKSLRVGEGTVRTSPFKPKGLLDQLLYPAEEPVAEESPFAAVRVVYPAAEVSFLGLVLPWWIWWLLLALVFALLLRKRLGVTI